MAALAPATTVWTTLAPALVALGGVLIGLIASPLFQYYARGLGRYDDAIAAVARQEALRHGRIALHLDGEMVRAVRPDDLAITEHELSTDGVRAYLEAASEARAALAQLYPWSPDLRKYWGQPKVLSFEECEEVLGILATRRRRPWKRHTDASSSSE